MGRADKYIRALKYGHKIMPDNLAGMLGLPYVGDVFYVDPNSGADTNGGREQSDAFATVSQALSAATSGQHDTIVIAPSGGTGRASESSAITWNKRFTHLVGSAAPVQQDNRAGISFATGGSLTISENGCLFKNLTFTSSADIDESVSITGSYNSFQGVDFKGTYNATSADSTPWRALNINGGQENYFGGCTFGSDTMTRGVANATLELESAASRNVFDSCLFTMHQDTATTSLHVLLTGTNAIDRWIQFNNCTFYSFYTNHADKSAAVFDNSAQATTADILMTGNNLAIGFDDWEASASNIMWFPSYEAQNAGEYSGLAINNA